MTYGRPSMTSHISPVYPVPLPSMRPDLQANDPCELSGQPCDHQLGYTTFYVSTIELYKILESILADVYNAWQSRSNHQRPTSLRGTRHSSLDVIMELDEKLSAYEADVPDVLNWTKMHPPVSADSHQESVFQRQRNVLRARYMHFFLTLRYLLTPHRFIHLRLLLYRPMFTQLCSEERVGSTRPNTATPWTRPERNAIYTSMSINCAVACVTAAMELVSLVHNTYRTSQTDAWWYNGFCTHSSLATNPHRASINVNQIHRQQASWS